MNWLSGFLSEETGKSSKRLVFLLSTTVFIIQHFLLMYIKIEIANKELVKNSQDWLGWIVMGSGCLVVTDKIKDWLSKPATNSETKQ